MASAHARWKDERTPPASLEEAIERGLIKPNNIVPINPDIPDIDIPDNIIPDTPILRPCEECGTSFEPKRSDARFCSDACRKRASRRTETAP
jgi:hypothetical protein